VISKQTEGCGYKVSRGSAALEIINNGSHSLSVAAYGGV